MKKYFTIALLLLLIVGCQSKKCELPEFVQNTEPVCESPTEPVGNIYDSWLPSQAVMHKYHNGLSFDVGSKEAEKYFERSGTSPWIEPELISAETAKKSKLPWAENRYVRWLGSTVATIHFPFFPDEWEGDLYVETGLRPKVNPSMAIRFYKPDGEGKRTWSQPLTTDLVPGYQGYRWKVPPEYLSKDGMQLMRVSFPGSYFEGENRVSAKFVHFAIGNLPPDTGRVQIESSPQVPEKFRVLDKELDAYGLEKDGRIERYYVVPNSGTLQFYTAPGAWLSGSGKLTVTVQTDFEKKELATIPIKPGECWHHQTIDLEDYGDEAVRLSFAWALDDEQQVFTPSKDFHPDIYISAPQIVIPDDSLMKSKSQFEGTKRVIVIAIDNLRADRLWNEDKRRGANHLGYLADNGVLGILMGEGKNFVAMETSFITGITAREHNVYEPGTFLRKSVGTIAEAAAEAGWKSYFYTTSSIIDTSHGLSRGFDEAHALNKDNITSTDGALKEVATALERTPENAFFYVHLSELRLPHRAPNETFVQWAVPGYNGPVNETAMNNIAVMNDPQPLDCEQFEAYYDAELNEVDKSIGQFISNLDSDTLVVIYGTHGTSLGKPVLGYEQGITPWELLTPFIIYRPEHKVGIQREGIADAATLSATVRSLMNIPTDKQTLFTLHHSRPIAEYDGNTATASMKYFYRIKREAVDSLFTTGLDDIPSQKDERPLPILRQALREQID